MAHARRERDISRLARLMRVLCPMKIESIGRIVWARIKNYARVAGQDGTSVARIHVNESTAHISELGARMCEKSLLSDTAASKPDYRLRSRHAAMHSSLWHALRACRQSAAVIFILCHVRAPRPGFSPRCYNRIFNIIIVTLLGVIRIVSRISIGWRESQFRRREIKCLRRTCLQFVAGNKILHEFDKLSLSRRILFDFFPIFSNEYGVLSRCHRHHVWPIALATGSRTITSDQTVYNNSSFFLNSSYDIIGWKFIICFAFRVIFQYTEKIFYFILLCTEKIIE